MHLEAVLWKRRWWWNLVPSCLIIDHGYNNCCQQHILDNFVAVGNNKVAHKSQLAKCTTMDHLCYLFKMMGANICQDFHHCWLLYHFNTLEGQQKGIALVCGTTTNTKHRFWQECGAYERFNFRTRVNQTESSHFVDQNKDMHNR